MEQGGIQMNWNSDIFLNDRVGLTFFWIWWISFVVTTVLFFDALMGDPRVFLFIASLLTTMVSELLYQVYRFKTEHYSSTTEDMEQLSEVYDKISKNGCH